jgi:hypothetical protein
MGGGKYIKTADKVRRTEADIVIRMAVKAFGKRY